MVVLRQLVVVIACGCAVWFAQPDVRAAGIPEPRYQNKLLGEWLLEIDPSVPAELRYEPFRHFDSNAVPFLLHLVGQTNVSLADFRMAVRAKRKRPDEDLAEQIDEIRADAARAIGEISPPAAEAVPALLATLQDDVQSVIESSAISLGKIVPPDTNAVAALAAVLAGQKFDPAAAGWPSNYEKSTSLKTARALAMVANTNRAVLPRAECILALARIGLDSPDTIRLLGHQLTNEITGVKQNIVNESDDLGDRAIPVLLAWADGADPVTRTALPARIWHWGVFAHHPTTNALVTTALLAMLDDPKARVRQNVVLALAWTRPVNDAVISALIKALDDPDQRVRVYAAQAFSQLGELAKPALAALQKAAASNDRQLASAATRAIRAIQGEKSGSTGGTKRP